MEKNFDQWNTIKKSLHNDSENRHYHEREIWWCALGANIGFEQDGSGKDYRRPVLILKGLSVETCVVIPLTTSKHAHKFRLSVGLVDGQDASALLSQIRVVDTKRLIRKVGYLDKEVFKDIQKAVKDNLL